MNPYRDVYCVRVLSNIAGSALTVFRRASGIGQEQAAEAEDSAQHEAMLLRRLAIGFALPLVALPSALSFTLGPAIAMPFGFAVVLAAFLLTAVLVLGISRANTQMPNVAENSATLPAITSAVCPGLIVSLDPSGHVLALDGRDRDSFMSYMRDPMGRALAEQFYVSDRIPFLSALDTLRQGADTAKADLRLERSSLDRALAQFATVRLDLTAARAADGSLLGFTGQMLDVAGEMQLRGEVDTLKDEAEAANETKSRFLAAVSHELRTPLNAILGFSDILAGEYFGKLENDRQREYVQLIRQSGAHLLSVVNAMLDMSRIEAGRYELMVEPFVVSTAVKDCENMLALQAREKGVVLTSRIGRGLGEVVADQRALRQILINLVGNAIKFTEQGGAVIVDAVLEAGNLKLVVSDTGIGIAPEKMAILGQPFTQAHDELSRRYEGSGLGLSLVKGLTALHGGSFEIESHRGEGTVVTILVPADGSGVKLVANDDEQTMVEFPPRLKAANNSDAKTFGQEKENVINGAKAKIA
ncbi:sensor histidine kinase [Agrobacterium sp. ES01]|uniref:sensor histidine kinase n=1 Tax=Agrobacterium sp. ES01 TaxID=3420714 RepID=UPI003D0D3B55